MEIIISNFSKLTKLDQVFNILGCVNCKPLDPGTETDCTAHPSLHKTAFNINKELLHMNNNYM